MKSTYLAAQAIGGGRLALAELPLTEPGTDHVRIRVETCGVCHSDAATVESVFPGIAYPRVPGHEVVGRIEAIGAGVEGWKVGDRVGVGFLGGACGVCNSCRRGDLINCTAQPFSGVHTDGGYAEVMIAKASALAAVPEGFDAVQAAPLLCAGLTVYTALRKASANPGGLVAIQGVGGLGHLGVQFARRLGLRVVAIARGAAKESLARELGAHEYIDAAAGDPAAALQKLGGARAIIATAADGPSMSGLVAGLAPRGTLVVVGGGGGPISVDPFALLFGERRIEGTLTGTPADAEDTLAFSAQSGVRVMTETVPLAEAPRAYARMMKNEAKFRMVLTMS